MNQLILPRSMAPMAQARGHRVRELAVKAMGKVLPMEHPGRKFGNTVSSWISDLVETRKTIILCWSCKPKFNHSRNHYYMDKKFPWCQGTCDGCREYAIQGQIYVHESFLTDPAGKTSSGQTWTPR